MGAGGAGAAGGSVVTAAGVVDRGAGAGDPTGIGAGTLPLVRLVVGLVAAAVLNGVAEVLKPGDEGGGGDEPKPGLTGAGAGASGGGAGAAGGGPNPGAAGAGAPKVGPPTPGGGVYTLGGGATPGGGATYGVGPGKGAVVGIG